MATLININKLEKERDLKSFNQKFLSDFIKKSTIKYNERIEVYLYNILLTASKIDNERYIYLPWLAKAIDVPLYKLKLAIPKTKKLFIGNKLIIANKRGVGYKVSLAHEASIEIGKSMVRGHSHFTTFYNLLELSDYDWKTLKDTYPEHYELFLKAELTASHMKIFHQANKKIIEESGKIMRLISNLRKETAQPEFYLEAQQELQLN